MKGDLLLSPLPITVYPADTTDLNTFSRTSALWDCVSSPSCQQECSYPKGSSANSEKQDYRLARFHQERYGRS